MIATSEKTDRISPSFTNDECRWQAVVRRDPAASSVGMSSYYFHRVFKTHTGLTPKGYAAAHRSHRIRHELAQKATVTSAIYGAGFNSNSRFYGPTDLCPDIAGASKGRANYSVASRIRTDSGGGQ